MISIAAMIILSLAWLAIFVMRRKAPSTTATILVCILGFVSAALLQRLP